MTSERIGWWRIGRLELYGRHSWAQEVARIIGGDLTPAII